MDQPAAPTSPDLSAAPSPPLSPALRVEVEQHGSHQVAVVTGEVDMSSVGTLRTQLRDLMVEGGPHLLVDLSGVPFMDSAGLAALVSTRRQARVFQGSFGLVAPSKQVSRLLTLTAMDKVFPCFASLEDALADGVGTGASG